MSIVMLTEFSQKKAVHQLHYCAYLFPMKFPVVRDFEFSTVIFAKQNDINKG